MPDSKTIEKENAFRTIGQSAIGAGVVVVKQSVFKSAFQQLEQDVPIDTSYLGTPIYDNITLGSINDKSANKYLDILGQEQTYLPIRLNEVLLDVSATKNITKKAIRGRNGTVKQYISRGDYSIAIRGRITGKFNETNGNWQGQRQIKAKYHPEREIKILNDICETSSSIPINSAYLNNIYKIDQIVIDDYRFTQEEGGRYFQGFELNCSSDRDVILEFTEEEVRDSERLNAILGI